MYESCDVLFYFLASGSFKIGSIHNKRKLVSQLTLTPVTTAYTLFVLRVYLYDILFQLKGCGFCNRLGQIIPSK